MDFHQYFRNIYNERWDRIFEALNKKELQVARMNFWTRNYFEHMPPDSVEFQVPSDFKKNQSSRIENLDHCFQFPSETAIERNPNGLLSYYVMDPASVIGARFLKIQTDSPTLDMCAAPGGKSLILLENFHQQNAQSEVWLNEISASRRDRLKKIIQNYIPTLVRSSLWIKGQDGARYGLKMKEHFGAILLDAPCSGERHFVGKSNLTDWKASHAKSLAIRQFSLLSSAYLALKVGGHLVYSTCSLNPLENDQVVGRLLERHEDVQLDERLVHLEQKDLIYGEKTKFGIQFLPDKCGFGPFYFSGLTKKAK